MSKSRVNWKYLALCLVVLLFYPAQAAAEYGADLAEIFPSQKLSMQFREAEVKNVLRSLAEPYKINLLVSNEVTGSVSASFKDVYVKDVFISVLRDADLDYVIDGDIVRIDTYESFIAKRKLEALVTRSLEVTYAFDSKTNKDLSNLAKELKKMLSGNQGSMISVVPRNNTLVITDIPEYVDRIVRIVEELDKESPQIAILAKIVEMSTDFSKELGVQWGAKLGIGGSEATGKSDTVVVQGGSMMGVGPNSDANFLVDLPATAGPGSGGAVNFLIGKIGNEILEVQLSAMENEGKGRVLSSPKIITQDNQKAYIESGDEIPYQTIQEGGAFEISFKEAVVSLEVTPHVIGNKVFMEVLIKKDTVDFTKAIGVGQEPPIKTNELNTKVLVSSGETVVIGGLISKDTSGEEGGVPFLRNIPFLGKLFSYRKDKKSRLELVIFITPNILKKSQN